jgi:hypothetical protein
MLTFKQYLEEKRLFGEANITRRAFMKGAGAALLPGAAKADSETVLKNIGVLNAQLNDEIRGHATGHGSPLTLSQLNSFKETDPERHSKYMSNLEAFKNNRGGMYVTNSDDEEKELYGKLHPSLAESTYYEAVNKPLPNYKSGRAKEMSSQLKADPRYVKGQTSQFSNKARQAASPGIKRSVDKFVKGQTSQFNPNRTKIASDSNVKNQTEPFKRKKQSLNYTEKRRLDRRQKFIDFSDKLKSFISNYRAN